MLLAAGRRFVLLAGGAILVVGLVSVALGALLGNAASRSAATGLYVVGGFVILVGVFAGVRGPLRARGGDEDQQALGGLFGVGIFATGIRMATADEKADARATTWLFLALGLAMIVVGAIVDPRTNVL